MPSKVTVTVVLTEDEKKRLKRLADSQDRSLSYLAGKFVREGLVRAEDEEIAQAKTRGNLRRELMLAELEEKERISPWLRERITAEVHERMRAEAEGKPLIEQITPEEERKRAKFDRETQGMSVEELITYLEQRELSDKEKDNLPAKPKEKEVKRMTSEEFRNYRG